MRLAAHSADLLDELEDSLNHGTIARRVETLRRVTDLFLAGAGQYSDQQTQLFDDVFACLVQKIEVSARALLATRLAPNAAAPRRIVHRLAFDEAILVAAPILTQSAGLDDDALAEIARSRSQEHLMAISRRAALSSQVTDVLVERGNDDVVESTVLNKGARFSDDGFQRLVRRADMRDDLALKIGRRSDLPRHHLLILMARASETVGARLRAEFSSAPVEVNDAVRTVASRLQDQTNHDITVAMTFVADLNDRQLLDGAKVAELARGDRVDETCAAISCLAGMPYDEVETAMNEERAEALMIVSKFVGLSWENLKTVLDMRSRLFGRTVVDEAMSRASYDRLRPTTAQQVLRFQRMQRAAAAPAGQTNTSIFNG